MKAPVLATMLCGLASLPACEGKQKAKPAPAPAPAPEYARADAHGFNDAIAWRSLDDGLSESATTGKPMMLVVHASWCGKCKKLKPAFQDARLVELSAKFAMVNVDQDKVPRSKSYAPDGDYVPRIVFIDPQSGNVDPSLKNPGRSRFHYFYMPQDDLAASMRRALERHAPKS